MQTIQEGSDSQEEMKENIKNVTQSVPSSLLSDGVSSFTASQSALSQISQTSRMANRSRFDWLRSKKSVIGRRTGKNVIGSKEIRKNERGLENFDDYLSESDVSTYSTRLSVSSAAVLRDKLMSPSDLEEVSSQESNTPGKYDEDRSSLERLTESQSSDAPGEKDNTIKHSAGVAEISRDVSKLPGAEQSVENNSGVFEDADPDVETVGNNSLSRQDGISNENVIKGSGDCVDSRNMQDSSKFTNSKMSKGTSSVNEIVVTNRSFSKHSQVSKEEDEGVADGQDVVSSVDDTETDQEVENDIPDARTMDKVTDRSSIEDHKESKAKLSSVKDVSMLYKSVNKTDREDVISTGSVLHGGKSTGQKSVVNGGDVREDMSRSTSSKAKTLELRGEIVDLESVSHEPQETSGIESENGYESEEQLHPSQAPSNIDVAGNQSGSITKLHVPASEVNFNRTKKRLSYSALEANEETLKLRKSRVEQANADLDSYVVSAETDKQESHVQKSVITDNTESEGILCLASRTRAVDNSTLEQDSEMEQDSEEEILILDDSKTSSVSKIQHKSEKQASMKTAKEHEKKEVQQGNKSKNRSRKIDKSLTDVKTEKSVKERRKNAGAVSKRKRSKALKEQLQDTVSDEYDIDKSDELEKDSEKTKFPKKNENEQSTSQSSRTKRLQRSGKRSELKSNKAKFQRTRSKTNNSQMDIEEKANDEEQVESFIDDNVHNLESVKEPKRKLTFSNGTSESHNSESTNKQLPETVARGKLRRNRVSVNKNKSDVENKAGKMQSDQSYKNAVSEPESSKGTKKRQSKKSKSVEGSNKNMDMMTDTADSLEVNTPRVESNMTLPTNYGSGVSFRVSRRSEQLEKISSGYVSTVNVQMQKVNGLTPCISRPGISRKSKGRRVTICLQDSDEPKIGLSHNVDTSEPIVKRFRHSRGLSACSTPLPDADSSPQHIFETTNSNTPQSAPDDETSMLNTSGIIYPAPAPPGLRRSKRTRIRPLEWYKNERVVVECVDESGPSIVGIKPSLEVKWKKLEEKKRLKRLLNNQIRKASKQRKFESERNRRLSLHVTLPKDVEVFENTSSEVTVIDPVSGEENILVCIAKGDNSKAVGPDNSSPKKEDPYLITPLLDHRCMSSGILLLKEFAEKPVHLNVSSYLVFYVIYGKVLVKIHETATLVETGDNFLVPFGSSYSIKNMRSDTAKLYYVNNKNMDSNLENVEEEEAQTQSL